MQIQDTRGGGFIVSPLSTVNTVKSVPKKPRIRKKHITENFFVNIKDVLFKELCHYSKAFCSTAMSLFLVISSVMLFCKFFTFGIVIYSTNGPVAYAHSETDYQNAL